MKKSFTLFLLALSFVLCFTAGAFAQRTTGDLEGTVTDPKGAVVPGANITVTGVNVGFTRSVTTDADGKYRVLQLPAGSYKISTAAINGFSATDLDNITVTLEKTTTADVVLGVSAGVNTVDVSSDPLGVNVDTSNSKVQTNITSQLIDELPKGTTFTSLLKVAPGVRNEPLSGGFQVDGASGSENSFVVDGQALENFRTGQLNQNNNIPTNLVQEIQIKTSGFEAEHGGASGGVVSVVTKGGTDQWRGEFGTQLETSKLQPGNRFVQSTFQNLGSSPQYVYAVRAPRDKFTNSYPTASLGGPIVKGRVWFYGNYSPQIFPLTRTTQFYNSLSTSSFTTATNSAGPGVASGVNLVTSTAYPTATYQQTVKNQYAFGRIDASIFNNLRYQGTYLWNPTTQNGTIPYATVSAGGTPNNARVYNGQTYTDSAFQRLTGGRNNSNNFTSQLIYSPTSKLVVTGRYARAFLNERGLTYAVPSGTRYTCSTLVPGGYTGVEGCTPGYDSGVNAKVNRDISLKNEYNADATYSLGSFGGRHEFKGGIQYGKTKNDVDGSTVNDATFGVITLRYGANFDSYIDSSFDSFCNLRTATNPTGTCLGVGRLYRYGTKGIASNKYIGLYIQDKWQPTSRLTLNLGVRDEKENLPAFNTGSGKGGIPLEFGFGKKIAPRLGVAYDIFGDGKTRVFASYGRFFDRLKFELPRGSFGGDFYRLDYFPILASSPLYSSYTVGKVLGTSTDPIGGSNNGSLSQGGISVYQQDQRIPSNITAAQAAALGLPFAGVDPNLKPFRQDEFTVGMERELSRQYVLSARFSRKNVASATEDHGILGTGGSENYIISNPGEGLAAQLDASVGYAKTLKPQRLYRGLEIALNKRLSHNYFYNVNYTLSKLVGNYSGLASSDEVTNGAGRASPGVSRYFDYIVNGFTFNGTPDNGDLATDRRHTFKAYGGYNFDWFGSKTNSTEFSFFQQVLQGTPQTTYIGISQSSIVFSKRGDLGRSPTFYQTDLSLSHRYKFGKDTRYSVAFDFNVLNAFNNDTVLLVNSQNNKYTKVNAVQFSDIDPTYNTDQNPARALNAILTGKFTPAMVDAALLAKNGGANPISVLYNKPSLFQAARNVRFGMRFFF